MKGVNDESRNIVRAQVTNIITNFYFNNRRETSLTNQLYLETTKFLKNNENLLVLSSDKGNMTVIMEKEEYYTKCNTLVNDEEVYTRLNKDPTRSIERETNAWVKKMKTNNYISAITAKQLMSYETNSPRLYGLPKVHKNGIPMRPIVNTIDSPTSKLSKYIAEILTTSFNEYNEYSIMNSKLFSDQINNFVLPEKYVLRSLDVISLFTNISIELTCHILDENWEIILPNTEIPKQEFIQIMEFLFNSNYFRYNDFFYKQKFGCPMGSTLSPILANIAMSTLLKTSIPRLSFQLAFIFQYVDDLILSIPEDKDEEILEIFNSFDDHIQFTIEVEKNRCVPFLDTMLHRGEDNVIRLDWYRKPSSSGRYINFSSYHNISTKTNIVLGLKKRIIDITHPDFRSSALRRLFELLVTNGYPQFFLKKLIYNSPRPNEDSLQQPQDNNVVENVLITKFPNIKNLTGEVIKLFKKHINIKVGQYNIVTCQQLYNKCKDNVPKEKKKNTIYKIDCKNCQLAYVGQSSQALCRRIALHKSDSILRPERCALGQHVRNTGHLIDFENITILDQEINLQKRLFLEMCHIQEKGTMNHKADTNDLSGIYSFLITCDSRSNISQEPTESSVFSISTL